MTDLVGFLLARIAEDEAVAHAAAIPAHDGQHKPHPEITRWRYRESGEVEYDYDEPEPYAATWYVTCDTEGITSSVDEKVGPHIARWDPARVLAECEAKRRIIEQQFAYEAKIDGEWGCCHSAAEIRAGQCRDTPVDGLPILRSLALPYADHPDYDEGWRP